MAQPVIAGGIERWPGFCGGVICRCRAGGLFITLVSNRLTLRMSVINGAVIFKAAARGCQSLAALVNGAGAMANGAHTHRYLTGLVFSVFKNLVRYNPATVFLGCDYVIRSITGPALGNLL